MAAAALDSGSGYRVRRLTRAAYDLLVGAGVYEGERVELIGGEVVEMAPQGPEYFFFGLSRLGLALQRMLDAHRPGAYFVRQQGPMSVTDDSEPEPDLAVVDDDANDKTSHPTTAHLVIEIAHTSHRIDLVRKPALYAASAVPLYWVVDLVARQVVVHTEPYPADGTNVPGYGTVRRLPLDVELDVLGVMVRLSDVVS